MNSPHIGWFLYGLIVGTNAGIVIAAFVAQVISWPRRRRK